MEKPEVYQEAAYKFPYHWLMTPLTRKGRMQFGRYYFIEKFFEGRILDAGCGDGRLVAYIQEKVPSAEVDGIDFSERALSFAKLLTNANYSKGSLIDLPYPDEYFDRIFCIETLEHIPPADLEKVVSGLYRVLKKNGVLVATVPSVLQKLGRKHYQHFTPESLTQALALFRIDVYGYMRNSFHPLKIMDWIFENKIWRLNTLANRFHTKIWPNSCLSICKPHDGRGLIAVGTKSLV